MLDLQVFDQLCATPTALPWHAACAFCGRAISGFSSINIFTIVQEWCSLDVYCAGSASSGHSLVSFLQCAWNRMSKSANLFSGRCVRIKWQSISPLELHSSPSESTFYWAVRAQLQLQFTTVNFKFSCVTALPQILIE
jgi:hypothetical protein